MHNQPDDESPLTAAAVTDVLLSMLYHDGETPDPDKAVKVRGVVTNYVFNPDRLDAARPKVAAFIKQLSPKFHRTGGGGWSFLNLCEDKDGRQWTGLHMTQEVLCVIAIATDMAQWLPPDPKTWKVMCPGGMPYVTFFDDVANGIPDPARAAS